MGVAEHEIFLTSMAVSCAVNAFMMGLTVIKLFKVYLEVKPLYSVTFGATRRNKTQHIMFILIESGMALFCIQLALLVLYIVWAIKICQPIYCIYEMIIVITNSVIIYILLITLD